jgi:hypothetical protein
MAVYTAYVFTYVCNMAQNCQHQQYQSAASMYVHMYVRTYIHTCIPYGLKLLWHKFFMVSWMRSLLRKVSTMKCKANDYHAYKVDCCPKQQRSALPLMYKFDRCIHTLADSYASLLKNNHQWECHESYSSTVA